MTKEEYLAVIDAAYSDLSVHEIERTLLGLLDDCAEKHGARSEIYAALESELGGFYRGQARYAESEKLFLNAAELLGGGNGPDYFTVLNNLAGTYRLMKRYDEAGQLFLKCLRGYVQTVGKKHILYASCLNNHALLLLDIGDTEKAAENLEKASEILSELPEHRSEYAVSLCNTGALLFRIGKLAPAEAYLENAVDLYENELGTRTPHYHAALNTLGHVCMAEVEFERAQRAFERALAAANDLYGPDHPETRAIAEALEVSQKRKEVYHEGD